MPVTVLWRQRVRGLSAATLRRQAQQLLRLLREPAAELTVALVHDKEMQRLNALYRSRNRPTDVLAFAMREGVRAAGDECLLGDVVISLETAARQAQQRKVALADEVTTLLIHGLLHLLGYDHERSAAEARRMRSRERQLKTALAQASDSRGG